jgi:hypothetical protein
MQFMQTDGKALVDSLLKCMPGGTSEFEDHQQSSTVAWRYTFGVDWLALGAQYFERSVQLAINGQAKGMRIPEITQTFSLDQLKDGTALAWMKDQLGPAVEAFFRLSDQAQSARLAKYSRRA